MNNYIIVGPARCGTSWISQILAFNLGLTSLPDFNFKNNSAQTVIDNANNETPWIAKLFTDELVQYDVPLKWWYQYATPVFIYRSNILDQFLSFVFANRYHVFNITNENSKPKYEQLKMQDWDYIHFGMKWDTFIKTKPHGIIMTYETMFEDITQILPKDYKQPETNTTKKLLNLSDKLKLLETPLEEIETRLKKITNLNTLDNFIW